MGARILPSDQDGEAAASPLRLCAQSRARKPPAELIRFVAAPDGTLVPDLARRLPGRGVWVDATRQTLTAAVRQKVFARSLQRHVSVPADLPDQVERLLARRLAQALSLATKAGLVVAGYAKVEERLARGRVAALIHAAEAGDRGMAKLDCKFKALLGGGDPSARIVRELTGAELSLAMGRPGVVHAAAAEGGTSQRLLEEARRLRRYRLGEGPGDPLPPPTNANTGRA